jgi:hypothetical protein
MKEKKVKKKAAPKPNPQGGVISYFATVPEFAGQCGGEHTVRANVTAPKVAVAGLEGTNGTHLFRVALMVMRAFLAAMAKHGVNNPVIADILAAAAVPHKRNVKRMTVKEALAAIQDKP